MSYKMQIEDLHRFGLRGSGVHVPTVAEISVVADVTRRSAEVVCACGERSTASGPTFSDTYLDLLWWAWSTGRCAGQMLAG